MPEPWEPVGEDAFDRLRGPLPELVIPRLVPSDPAVFTMLGPLPHARIEASLCLAALLHRTGQWVQEQFEQGPKALEGESVEGEMQSSPFDSNAAVRTGPRPWRGRKKWKK